MFCAQVDLHPSGKVMMAVQYFLEGVDTGEIKQNVLSFLTFFLCQLVVFLNSMPQVFKHDQRSMLLILK